MEHIIGIDAIKATYPNKEEWNARRQAEFDDEWEKLQEFVTELTRINPAALVNVMNIELLCSKDGWKFSLSFDISDPDDPLLIINYRAQNDGKCVQREGEYMWAYLSNDEYEREKFFEILKKDFTDSSSSLMMKMI